MNSELDTTDTKGLGTMIFFDSSICLATDSNRIFFYSSFSFVPLSLFSSNKRFDNLRSNVTLERLQAKVKSFCSPAPTSSCSVWFGFGLLLFFFNFIIKIKPTTRVSRNN